LIAKHRARERKASAWRHPHDRPCSEVLGDLHGETAPKEIVVTRRTRGAVDEHNLSNLEPRALRIGGEGRHAGIGDGGCGPVVKIVKQIRTWRRRFTGLLRRAGAGRAA
jgi:hypothetical protein